MRYPGPSNLGFLCRAVSENCLRVPIWVVQDLADEFTVVGDDVNDVEADWLSVVVPADAKTSILASGLPGHVSTYVDDADARALVWLIDVPSGIWSTRG